MKHCRDKKLHCLLVGRPSQYRDRLQNVLERSFCRVTSVERRYQSLVHLSLDLYDVVALEEKPNEPRLCEYIDLARTVRPDLAIALLASRLEIQHAVQAMRQGADDVLFRPVILNDFGPRLIGAIHRRWAIHERSASQAPQTVEEHLACAPGSTWESRIHECRRRLLEQNPCAPGILGTLVNRCEEIGAENSLSSVQKIIRTAQLWELDLAFCESRDSQQPIDTDVLDAENVRSRYNGEIDVLRAAVRSIESDVSP